MKRREFLLKLGLIPITQLLPPIRLNPFGLSTTSTLSLDNAQPVMSGINSLDNLKGGFHPKELTIIAGRPSVGKTTIALNIARNISLTRSQSVALYSLELAKEQVMTRLLAIDSGLKISKIRKGTLGNEKIDKLLKSSERLSTAKLNIIDNYGMTPTTIRQTIVRGARLDGYKKPDLIIVDYFQLMNTDTTLASRALESESILIGLKRVAVELNLPVVVLAQLNRGAESRSDRRPSMSDFRDFTIAKSSAVDSAILLYRESYYERENATIQHDIEFNVVKNSLGKTGIARAMWNSDHFKITS